MSGTLKKNEILAFSAITKTGSVTMLHLLRRHFGIRHFRCTDRRSNPRGNTYLAEDLRYDLRIHPWARSIAGHGLKPYTDYEEFQSRLVWYTMLRDPIRRFISQYKYEVALGRVKEDLVTWMRRYPRDNFQVLWLGGGQSLQAAKDIVLGRMRAIGLVEHFDESLLIFRQRLGLPDWDVVYSRPRNVARDSDVFRDLPALLERHKDEIVERNSLDILLYEFVRDEVWPKQVSDYGGSQKLEEERQSTFAHSDRQKKPNLKQRWRNAASVAYRYLVYNPAVRLDRFMRRRARAELL